MQQLTSSFEMQFWPFFQTKSDKCKIDKPTKSLNHGKAMSADNIPANLSIILQPLRTNA